MKIVIVQGAFLPVPPIRGGAVEKIWYKLGQEFANQGHEIIHICKKIDELPEVEIINKVKYIRVIGYEIPKSLFILKLLDLIYSVRIISRIPIDVNVIVTNTFWGPIFIRRKLGQKVYVSVERFPKWQMKLYTHVFRYRANSSSVFQEIKNQINEKYHNKIILIPNPLPFEIEKDNFLNFKKKIILYVGRLHPEKGLDILIKSYKLSNNDYKLIIIGPWDTASGGGGAKYFKYLKTLSEGIENLSFLGPLYDDNLLKNHFKEATIFIYPSVAEKGETFGLSILEAMAFGCIPIVSELKCFLDFIRPNENGLVFNHNSDYAIEELSNQIKLIQENTALRVKLAEEATKVNQSHSIKVISKLFLDDFNQP